MYVPKCAFANFITCSNEWADAFPGWECDSIIAETGEKTVQVSVIHLTGPDLKELGDQAFYTPPSSRAWHKSYDGMCQRDESTHLCKQVKVNMGIS